MHQSQPGQMQFGLIYISFPSSNQIDVNHNIIINRGLSLSRLPPIAIGRSWIIFHTEFHRARFRTVIVIDHPTVSINYVVFCYRYRTTINKHVKVVVSSFLGSVSFHNSY